MKDTALLEVEPIKAGTLAPPGKPKGRKQVTQQRYLVIVTIIVA